MPDKQNEKPLSEESNASPDVKVKHAGGRPSKDRIIAPVMETINISAPRAAEILSWFIDRKKGYKTISRDLIEACKYVIDHAIGKARQKIEHTGGVMTYKELMDSAGDLEKKGRDILADVEEIANKYPGATPENKAKKQ